MADTVDPKDCPCALNVDSVKCLWPLLHKDLREISVKSTFRGVTIGNLMSNELSTRAGQRRAQQNLLLDQAGLTQRCLERLKSYSRSLGNNLYAKVFQSEDKKMVESIRVVLDLETLAIKLSSPDLLMFLLYRPNSSYRNPGSLPPSLQRYLMMSWGFSTEIFWGNLKVK